MSGLHPPLLPQLDDAPGPATPLSERGRIGLRDRILNRAQHRARRRRDLLWLRTPLGVAAACALAFASVGTGLAAVRVWPSLSAYLGSGNDREPSEPVVHKQLAAANAGPRPKPRPTPAQPLPAAEAAAVEGVAAADSASDSSAPQAVASTRAAQRRNPSQATAEPLDLLAQANRLRGEQRWQQAETLYLRVLATEDGQLAQATAALAAADLRLQHLGKPRSALALFERALRLQPAGALAEQARHGLAKCYRALGDDLHEIEALNAYLHAHPQSPMATRNAARLRELSGSSPVSSPQAPR